MRAGLLLQVFLLEGIDDLVKIYVFIYDDLKQ